MQNSTNSLRKSIFGKLILTFVLIMIPIYIMGALIYQWAIGTVKQELGRSVLAQVSYFMDSLEKEVDGIKSLQLQCVSDRNLDMIVNRWEIISDYDKVYYTIGLQQRLNAIRSSSFYIKHVASSIPNRELTISEVDGYGKFDEKKYSELKNRSTLSKSFFYCNGSLYLSSVYSPSAENKEPLFGIEVELDESAFRGTLRKLYSSEAGGVLLYSAADELVISEGIDNTSAVEIKSIVNDKSRERTNGTLDVSIRQKNFFISYAKSEKMNLFLVAVYPQETVFEPLKQYAVWVWFFSIMVVLLITIFSFSIYKLVKRPMAELVKAFKKVENGDLNVSLQIKRKDEFHYLYLRFNTMVETLKNLVEQIYKQKILAQKAELKQLQAQINPHFLYNSFFILHRRIKSGDNETALNFSKQLGTFFKFITRSAADKVSLESEVEHARVYAQIQAMTHSSRITVHFEELPKNLYNIIVPRLILQPIIENAFEHGLQNKVQDGLIYVKFTEEKDYLKIIIEDNGDETKDEDIENMNIILDKIDDDMETTGILNIHRRLHLSLGPESGLKIKRSSLGGLCVNVILPIKMEG